MPGGRPGPSHRLRVKAGTLSFDEIVEPVLSQQLIHAPIKRVTRCRGQVHRRDPHHRLSIAFAFAHRHGGHCSTPITLEPFGLTPRT